MHEEHFGVYGHNLPRFRLRGIGDARLCWHGIAPTRDIATLWKEDNSAERFVTGGSIPAMQWKARFRVEETKSVLQGGLSTTQSAQRTQSMTPEPMGDIASAQILQNMDLVF